MKRNDRYSVQGQSRQPSLIRESLRSERSGMFSTALIVAVESVTSVIGPAFLALAIFGHAPLIWGAACLGCGAIRLAAKHSSGKKMLKLPNSLDEKLQRRIMRSDQNQGRQVSREAVKEAEAAATQFSKKSIEAGRLLWFSSVQLLTALAIPIGLCFVTTGTSLAVATLLAVAAFGPTYIAAGVSIWRSLHDPKDKDQKKTAIDKPNSQILTPKQELQKSTYQKELYDHKTSIISYTFGLASLVIPLALWHYHLITCNPQMLMSTIAATFSLQATLQAIPPMLSNFKTAMNAGKKANRLMAGEVETESARASARVLEKALDEPTTQEPMLAGIAHTAPLLPAQSSPTVPSSTPQIRSVVPPLFLE